MTEIRTKAPGYDAGIDEPLIRLVVTSFYDRVRADDFLGSIFTAAIKDWVAHINILTRFWSSIILMDRSYHGTPLQAHLALPKLEPAHFKHWLALFEATLIEHCTAEQADVFRIRAHRIAQSFQYSIAQQHGILPLENSINS